jgi:hypothetical protein
MKVGRGDKANVKSIALDATAVLEDVQGGRIAEADIIARLGGPCRRNTRRDYNRLAASMPLSSRYFMPFSLGPRPNGSRREVCVLYKCQGVLDGYLVDG